MPIVPLSFSSLVTFLIWAIQRKWNTLHPELTKTTLTFSFILAASICVALSLLTCWNLYLIMSAQTTIEFYHNRAMSKEMRQRGIVFANDYDLGTLANLRNFFNTKK